MGCESEGKHTCQKKLCNVNGVKRTFCDLHHKDGGHCKHEGKEFKPMPENVSELSTVSTNS